MTIPLPAFRYSVVLGSTSLGGLVSAVGGFSECSGIELQTDVYEYAEGGVNDYVHRLPTRTKPSDIVLKRGLILTSDLWDWIEAVSEGRYKRKDGIIIVKSATGLPTQAWAFTRGLPIKWSGPALAASRSEIATESLTIAHEGLTRIGV
ncbi:phage tail protein [Sorangium sp. So ce117]|uniref:phage tail protein n=1 Tax=Sorangium sp. So ce117 TaxID=3133277 RepID=UPI003F5DE24F